MDIFIISDFKYDTKYRNLKTLILLNKNISLQDDGEEKSQDGNCAVVL